MLGVYPVTETTPAPADDQHVFYLTKEDAPGRRVLFVGNSITLHSARPEIGWHGDWGMAASDAAHDYLHLVMAERGGMFRHLEPLHRFATGS